MQSILKVIFLLLLFFLPGCSQKTRQETFIDELDELQDYFHIPGLAFIVAKGDSIKVEGYFGYSDVPKETPMDSVTAIPMASLTKMFTGYLLAQVSRRGILDRPIRNYVNDPGIPDSILVKHVLSHTSEGQVGKHFHYSNRFSWLSNVISEEFQGSYEAVVNAFITAPYEMNHTFLLSDKAQLDKRAVAMPYVFDGSTKPGFIDYGFSASAGVTSTVRDLSKFSRMMSHTMVENERAPFDKYNWGLFGQEIQGVKILWAYGQYDCYSSLFIKVPDRELTFIVAGNNSLIADPARLIYGDITTSLFALSFLKHYVLQDIGNNHDFKRRELLAKAVAESYLAVYDPPRAENSKKYLREVFAKYDDYHSLTTMHNIVTLKEIAANHERTEFTEFDPQLKACGEKLLMEDPDDPYANIYMGNYYDSKNDIENARKCYTRIADAKNFSRNWYTNEAEQWLTQHVSTSKPGTTTPPRE